MYSVGDLVCFKTDQSGWTTAGRIIGFEGGKLVWIIVQGMPACVAVDRLRPVNAAEALTYQHLKDQGRLDIALGGRTGFIDATEPFNPIAGGDESPQEIEGMSDDETPQLEDTPPHQRRARRRARIQTDVTVEGPGMEIVPPSRRRSREEQHNDQANVPISIRRRFSSQEPHEEVPVVDSTASQSRASNEPSPLIEMFQRTGTTGPGVELAEDGWSRTQFADRSGGTHS